MKKLSHLLLPKITIFARNDQTYNGCGRRFVLSTNKTLKTFVKLLRGSFFKRSCEIFLYLKSFSKKILLNLVLSLFMKKSTLK